MRPNPDGRLQCGPAWASLQVKTQVSQDADAGEAHHDSEASGQRVGGAAHLLILLRIILGKALLRGCINTTTRQSTLKHVRHVHQITSPNIRSRPWMLRDRGFRAALGRLANNAILWLLQTPKLRHTPTPSKAAAVAE